MRAVLYGDVRTSVGVENSLLPVVGTKTGTRQATVGTESLVESIQGRISEKAEDSRFKTN